MALVDLETGNVPNYYADEFFKFMEDNLGFFSNRNVTKDLTFTPAIGHKFEGDFYGLLNHLNIEPHLHYLTMRINGLDNPAEFKADTLVVRVYTGGQDAIIANALSTKTR